jgi:pyruvate dehydrogenase E2 component (dihydrolipoamide acetyltransferase)
MAEIIRMPRMSDTMTEGVLVEWHKKVGDTIKSGDILAEVETDKATMDLESFQEGTLLHLGVEKGAAVPVDSIIAILGKSGEDISAILAGEGSRSAGQGAAQPAAAAPAPAAPAPSAAPAAAPAPASAPATAAASVAPAPAPAAAPTDNGRIKASPLAKSLARERGLDIAQIAGSGEQGRIVKRDVESFVPAAAAAGAVSGAPAAAKPAVVLPPVIGQEQYTEQAVSQMRKTIARRLAESKFSAPHFYLTMDINMAQAAAARARINEVSPVKISFNDMVVKAAAVALRQHQAVNSSWLGDRIRSNQHVHIGVAVAVDEGLLVPVIRFADSKGLAHISAETRELAEKARNKKLQPSEWEGNTFTISNLGMFGIEEFTAIINPPDACIMAVGAIRDVPVVENGAIVPGQRMKVTLSCDHRVVDGAVGSKFLNTFRELLEEPVRLLV